jgi:hypothetical protein
VPKLKVAASAMVLAQALALEIGASPELETIWASKVPAQRR